jgi:hypothetical protein
LLRAALIGEVPEIPPYLKSHATSKYFEGAQNLNIPKEGAYLGLHDKPGVEALGPVFIEILPWKHSWCVGGRLDITYKSGR